MITFKEGSPKEHPVVSTRQKSQTSTYQSNSVRQCNPYKSNYTNNY